MNKTLGLQLIVYSLLLVGFSYLVHHLAPALARPTLTTGLVGGVCCLVWGLRALGGSGGKALSILTLIPINFVMLAQMVITWGGGGQEVPGRRLAPAVITILFVMSLGMLLRIAYAGALFDVQPATQSQAGGHKP